MIKFFLGNVLNKNHFKIDAEKREVHFSLRLKERPYQVTVAGSFNQWSCFSHALHPTSSGAWETSIRLAPGIYQYQFFVNNAKWVLDSAADAISNEYGGVDSVLVVGKSEAAVPKQSCAFIQQEQCA